MLVSSLSPPLLIPCPSCSFPSVLLSVIISPLLSSWLLSCFSFLQSSSVLATPSIIPTQGELEAVQALSLESRLGDFQPRSPGFTPGCRPESWQLGEAIVRERLTTHGSFCAKYTCKHVDTHILTHMEPHIRST